MGAKQIVFVFKCLPSSQNKKTTPPPPSNTKIVLIFRNMSIILIAKNLIFEPEKILFLGFFHKRIGLAEAVSVSRNLKIDGLT